MIPKAAIEKAIERGWKYNGLEFEGHPDFNDDELAYGWVRTTKGTYTVYRSEIALDPSFWQAVFPVSHYAATYWFDMAQKFSRLILTGGDLEAYWNELLSTPSREAA